MKWRNSESKESTFYSIMVTDRESNNTSSDSIIETFTDTSGATLDTFPNGNVDFRRFSPTPTYTQVTNSFDHEKFL